MSGNKEEYVIIKDKESVFRMLENAEIEYEEDTMDIDNVTSTVRTESGIVFEFDINSGDLKGLWVEE